MIIPLNRFLPWSFVASYRFPGNSIYRNRNCLIANSQQTFRSNSHSKTRAMNLFSTEDKQSTDSFSTLARNSRSLQTEVYRDEFLLLHRVGWHRSNCVCSTNRFRRKLRWFRQFLWHSWEWVTVASQSLRSFLTVRAAPAQRQVPQSAWKLVASGELALLSTPIWRQVTFMFGQCFDVIRVMTSLCANIESLTFFGSSIPEFLAASHILFTDVRRMS